ncbi:MAG: exodeoxyribonuclease VII small subunit [Eubacterium sp.]|nr:exodeoxyribonuclease VII small subunit [Eubacterium sp.]
MEEKKDTFEESLEKLRQAADRIKSDDTTLEDSIKCYEEGMRYYNECNEILKSAEQKIELMDIENAGE